MIIKYIYNKYYYNKYYYNKYYYINIILFCK